MGVAPAIAMGLPNVNLKLYTKEHRGIGIGVARRTLHIGEFHGTSLIGLRLSH